MKQKDKLKSKTMIMKARIIFSITFSILLLSSCSNAQEQATSTSKKVTNVQELTTHDLGATRWRGPSAEGIYSSTELLNEWPESGPEIIWSYENLGQGHSSAVIANDYLYTSGMTDGTGHLFKFDLNGQLVYDKAYGPEYVESYYGTRGSPTIAGDKIYLVSAYGVLMCLEEADGAPVWQVDMVNEFGGDTLRWGYCETPVVDGDVVYATPGGQKDNVVALNRHDGSVIWSCEGKGELSAYCTPLLINHNGRKILTTHTASNLLGIDAKSGELLWTQRHPNKWSVQANTPIYRDGGLYYFSGYGQGSGKLILNEDGSKVTQAWKNAMDSRMGGAVLIDGYIYGSGDNYREWKAIDWETGKDAYASDTIAKGVVIYADGKLYAYSDKGELAMAKVNPEEFDLLSKTRVTKGSEQHWAHPVIHMGTLYLRHGKAMIAYKIN